MPQQTKAHVQMAITGLNAQTPPHLLGETEAQSALNIDFSLERGAAAVRRGSAVITTFAGPVHSIFKRYANYISDSTLYVFDGGTLWRGTVSTGSFTAINTSGGVGPNIVSFGNYNDETYLVAGSGAMLKDNGTSVTEWIKQRPDAPTVTLSTLTPLALGTVWVQTEGGSSTYTGTATGTVESDTFRATFDLVLTTGTAAVDLTTNGSGALIGDYGIHFVDLRISDPSAIRKVSYDFAVGDSTFNTFWHGEIDARNPGAALAEVTDLVEAQLNEGTTTDVAITETLRSQIEAIVRTANRPPQSNISRQGTVFASVGIPRSEFHLVGDYAGGTAGTNPWSQIYKMRVIVEGTKSGVVVEAANAQINGAQGYPLNDIEVGYTWWQTWVSVDTNSRVTGESAPSPASSRYHVQNGRAVIVTTSTATGTRHGITHSVIYRQGGYMNDAYAVGTLTYTSTGTGAGTATFTDTINDIQALSNGVVMLRNVHSRSSIPGEISYICAEPFYDRALISYENVLMWSLPGKPDAFPRDSYAMVSHRGDEVQAIIPWSPGAVIVNRDSVYEFHGNVFEGADNDWVLQRTASRRGCKAPRASIKTPYGIPLLDYDGLSLYIPGQGVDKPLEWVSEQIGDAWRGNSAADPAALKGSRVPAINFGQIINACAGFADDKLYLGIATGTNTYNDTVFVLDFRAQQCWWYTYPFNVQSLFWDFLDNKMFAGGAYGTASGALVRIDVGVNDIAGTSTGGIPWRIVTREWTSPEDSRLENLAIEYYGTVTASMYANQVAFAVGSATSSVRGYTIPGLFDNSGTAVNNAYALLTGTQSGDRTVIYGYVFDSLPEPAKVPFFRTHYEMGGAETDKLWDVAYFDLEYYGSATTSVSGTTTTTSTPSVLAVTFVDGSAVMTNTISATDTARHVYMYAFPAEIYGRVAYSTLSSPPSRFKLWEAQFQGRVEPPKINYWRTDIESLEERICDGFDVDLNPNGTVTGIVYVDNTATFTGTFTGTKRQSYTFALPNETYGRTIYVSYTGSGLKHYKTWFHMREEPDRWTNFVTSRVTGEEQLFDHWWVDINCLGGTCLSTMMVDGSAVGTYTNTGSFRRNIVHSFPPDIYGRSWYVTHNAQGTSTGGRFKHFETQAIGTPEPPRVDNDQQIFPPVPAENYLKTWVAELNPLGTCTGTLYADGTAISTATFTGTIRQSYNVGIDLSAVSMALLSGRALEVRYNAAAGGVLKHYKTTFETETKPFGKSTWAITYKKIGGASQLDMGRFFAMELEPGRTAGTYNTATITSVWDTDLGTAQATNTFTVSTRTYLDRVSFPPGVRGRLFQQRVLSNTPIMVWRSSLDMERIGVKGLTRTTVPGTPNEQG
jgi:hypothetical protein